MKKWQFRHTLIASVLVHVTLMLATAYAPRLFKPIEREVVEISFTQPPPPPVTVVEVPAKKKPLPLIQKQVVDQDEKAVNDEVPEDTKFLSAHNQVVKKQTVAQELGDFKNRRDQQSKGDGGSPKLTLDKLKPKMDFSKMIEEKREKERELERTLDENAMKVASSDTRLKEITRADKEGSSGADRSQTSDYLKDVEKGAETLLSTREFVYYSFYARIRRQLNQHWGGKVREKMTKIIKEGRTIASTDDKVTRLMITLNRKGQLVKVQVLNDSGIRDLDDAAIEAFQEAAPFPNPPEGIVERDGTIKIRWDFILEA